MGSTHVPLPTTLSGHGIFVPTNRRLGCAGTILELALDLPHSFTELVKVVAALASNAVARPAHFFDNGVVSHV
jgi:hypothetical protein